MLVSNLMLSVVRYLSSDQLPVLPPPPPQPPSLLNPRLYMTTRHASYLPVHSTLPQESCYFWRHSTHLSQAIWSNATGVVFSGSVVQPQVVCSASSRHFNVHCIDIPPRASQRQELSLLSAVGFSVEVYLSRRIRSYPPGVYYEDSFKTSSRLSLQLPFRATVEVGSQLESPNPGPCCNRFAPTCPNELQQLHPRYVLKYFGPPLYHDRRFAPCQGRSGYLCSSQFSR